MNKTELTNFVEQKLADSGMPFLEFNKKHLDLFKQEGLLSMPESYPFTNLATFFESVDLSFQKNSISASQNDSDIDFINLTISDEGAIFFNHEIKGLKVSKMTQAEIEFLKNNGQASPLTHLHHALIKNGIVLEIAKNTSIEKPIRLVYLNETPKLFATTLFIKLGANSRATLLDESRHIQNQIALIHETYIEVGPGANLEHIQLHQNDKHAINHLTNDASVEKDGNYRNIIFNLSGKLNRCNLNLRLTDSGARGESFNLYLTNDFEHSDINTVIHHLAADTTSQQIAKGILNGDSKGIFTGKIHIHPHAQRVVSGQLNKNLILSKKAQAHSMPQLEIFADDVKCSHGSTTGELSDEEIFYFEARGIPKDQAKTILANGFGLEIVHKIENKILRKKIEKVVLDHLHLKFKLGGQHE
jgi:Fe-S cluster assembly protein SufD